MDGLNIQRTARVAELLTDFRSLQYYIAAAPTDPPVSEDSGTEGWRALQQCARDGYQILNCAADTKVPVGAGGEQEQEKAELQQVHLDAYSRRHQGQKIYLRQAAARRWVERRDQFLQGQRPQPSHEMYLRTVDEHFHAELSLIADDVIYAELQMTDRSMGRWTAEDPSLDRVMRWLATRTPA